MSGADSWTGQPGKASTPWWKAVATSRGEELFATMRAIKRSNGSRDRRLADIHHLRLYTNYDVAGDGRRPQTGLFRTEDGRIRYNLIASAVDTAASVIAQQRPRPMFLTTQGDFALQNKARKRTRALEGQLYDLGVYDAGPEIFRDGAVLGTGFLYGYLDEDNRPKVERCLPLEIVVDNSEGIAGKPRTIYRHTTVPREVLASMFPKHKKKIELASGPNNEELVEFQMSRDNLADRVLVVEGWHLESRKGAKDGRHVIAVSNCTLLDEEYTRKRLPFAVYRWQTRPMGFFGMGIAEKGRDPQWRVNKLIRQYERLQDLGTNTWLLVEGNSKVRVESITNKPLEIIRYNGTPPTPLQLSAVPPGLQAEIDAVREQFFSELGISTMLAEGKKPSGLDSGQAQRTHDDILSRRHVMNAKAYEAFYMDVCDLISDLNDQAAEIDPEFCVASATTRGRQQYIADVKWADVAMDEGDSRLRMFPTSALPTTPQGKFAQIQEYIASGWISKPFGMALMDMPDLDAATRIELADMDAVMSDIERILEGEDGVYPEPYQSLEMALYVSRRSYLQAKISGAPESVLQAFRDYVDAALEMTQAGADVGQQAANATQALAAEQPQPVPGAQAAPPGVPGGMTMQ